MNKHQIPIKIHCLTCLSIFGRLSKNVFLHVKLLFTVCFSQSQSKDIFSYLNFTVYSCYSCFRHRRGSIFFILSVVYIDKHQIPIKIQCLARLSVKVKLLFSVCLKLSQSKNIFCYLNTTVNSCYTCVRHRGGVIFF